MKGTHYCMPLSCNVPCNYVNMGKLWQNNGKKIVLMSVIICAQKTAWTERVFAFFLFRLREALEWIYYTRKVNKRGEKNKTLFTTSE